MDKNFSRQHFEIFFLIFFQKIGFNISCKLFPYETICKKCQAYFQGKITTISSVCHQQNLPKVWLRLIPWMMAESYCIYRKYLDTSTPYHTCSKIWTCTIYYPLCLKIAGWVTNSETLMRCHILQHLIWVYTVCSGLSVWIHMVKIRYIYNLIGLETSCSVRIFATKYLAATQTPWSINLTFTTLLAFSADDKLMIFFLFFPANRIRHFMQIVSLGDNLHEMSIPVFWEK